VYLIWDQGEAALFEVGMSVTTPLVLAQLESLGVAAGEVAWVMLSHAHSDHSAGANGLLAGLPRARLVLTATSRDLLLRPTTLERFSGDDAFSSSEVTRREGLAEQEAWPPLSPPPPERLHLAEPGQSLQVGGEAVEFMPSAGHAPGGLVAWLPGQGALLASDSAGFRQAGRCGFPLYFVSYPRYQANLAALAARRPQVLGLGHQGSLAGARARDYLEDTAAHLEDYHRRIARRFQKGHGPARISAWLFETFYRDELTIYGPGNISYCCDLLVKRSLRHAGLLA
jgi:glyoxylase-like metal-dependent hydrolase (beta-lactamase superfamily II)